MCDPTAVSFLMMWRNGGAKIAPLLGLVKKDWCLGGRQEIYQHQSRGSGWHAYMQRGTLSQPHRRAPQLIPTPADGACCEQ
jgi:hypothetical protein